jgi:predicted signal transduction protein with EAL and GGDEF domain
VLPARSVVARLGGDEFAALVEETDGAAARQCGDAVIDAMGQGFEVVGRRLFLTASVGLLITDPAERPPTTSEALRDADLALYAAKESGKSRVVLFHPRLRGRRMDYARISNGLRRALSQDELVLRYQPVIHLNTRRVIGWSRC